MNAILLTKVRNKITILTSACVSLGVPSQHLGQNAHLRYLLGFALVVDRSRGINFCCGRVELLLTQTPFVTDGWSQTL